MADLNIPNLNKKSDKYLFKKKLTLRRKSKKRLFNESLLMIFISALIIYLNLLIPNKRELFNSISSNFESLIGIIIELFYLIYNLFLVFFILISLSLAILLAIGSFYRLLKIIRRKTKYISYK